MSTRYAWQGTDNPPTVNEAVVAFTDDQLDAHGTQEAQGYEATWSLETTHGWVTARLVVDVVGDGWTRHLELTRDDLRTWRSQTHTSGHQPTGLREPGIAEPAALVGALDCDLGLCPLTNTMPIRRLNLQSGQVPDTPLLMAWVDMPSLAVIPSHQVYASLDREHVRYVSRTRDVDVALSVDEHGVVVDYPGLATRVRCEPLARDRLLERWSHLPPLDTEQVRKDVDEIVDWSV